MLKHCSTVAVLVNLSSLKRWKNIVCTVEPKPELDAASDRSSWEGAAMSPAALPLGARKGGLAARTGGAAKLATKNPQARQRARVGITLLVHQKALSVRGKDSTQKCTHVVFNVFLPLAVSGRLLLSPASSWRPHFWEDMNKLSENNCKKLQCHNLCYYKDATNPQFIPKREKDITVPM